nr:SRPBCC family protein [uncultured Desulfuromonas sp.]
MHVYTLKRVQSLPIDIETAWDFFSNPANLEKITPAWLNFKVRSELPPKMYAGLIVQYFVHPVARIPVPWTTEITHVDEPCFFVDEQRLGPYKFWHHQHHFTPSDAGIVMTDIVHYALPFGPAGRAIHPIYIKRKLEAIFDHRFNVLKQRFSDNA